MGVWLWHWNQSPSIPMVAPIRGKTETARQVRSNVKFLLTVFFDCNGVVHFEFMPQGRTANKEYCLEVKHRLRKVSRQNRTELYKNQSRILHHDNAPAHTSMLADDRKQNRNHVSTTVFTGLGAWWFFPISKTKDTDKRKVFYYDWGDKKYRNKSCWRYRKAHFSSVSRFGKNTGISVFSEFWTI